MYENYKNYQDSDFCFQKKGPGWMGGWVDGQMDRWMMDGWMDGCKSHLKDCLQ